MPKLKTIQVNPEARPYGHPQAEEMVSRGRFPWPRRMLDDNFMLVPSGIRHELVRTLALALVSPGRTAHMDMDDGGWICTDLEGINQADPGFHHWMWRPKGADLSGPQMGGRLIFEGGAEPKIIHHEPQIQRDQGFRQKIGVQEPNITGVAWRKL